MREIELKGCRYEPLMSYLKAIGVLKIVAQQKDTSASGCWCGNHLVLNARIDEKELVDFFIKDYRPTPVFSPWNKGSGFYPRGKETEAVKIIRNFRERKDARLRAFSETIQLIEEGIKDVMGKKPEDVDNKTIEVNKEKLMAYCRNTLPDELVEWIDTVYTIAAGAKSNYQTYYAIIMGSGGNDGNLEFSINYLRSISEVFDDIFKKPGKACAALRKSLFDAGDEPTFREGPIGFFHPGGVGGPNATEGFEGGNLSNPWDYIFMVEGVLLFAGSVNRRLSKEVTGRVASFPFSVASTEGGTNVISAKEGTSASSRGELWLPLWKNFLGLSELRKLFAEGRARVGRRTARNGLDFARALATLGVSRGIRSFIRYGIYQRSGKSYLAVPLGVIPAKEKELKGADLLSDIERWLNDVQDVSMKINIPVRARQIPRRIHDDVFKYLLKGDTRSFQELIISLGKAQTIISALKEKAKGKEEEERKNIDPISLKYKWASYADDGTPEFRIAYALAGIGCTDADMRPIREDIDNVVMHRMNDGSYSVSWAKEEKHKIPCLNDPLRFLASAMGHRCMLGKKEERKLAPIGSLSRVPLDDLAKFLSGDVDYRKIVDLFLGLLLISEHKPVNSYGSQTSKLEERKLKAAYNLPRDYILLKTCFLPKPLSIDGQQITVPYDLKTLNLLRAHRVTDACQNAARKLKSAGIEPIAAFGKDGVGPICLYAALLIPVDVLQFTKDALPLIRKRDWDKVR